MSQQTVVEEIPLSQAALRLRVSGDRARRKVLTGELEGRLVAGRWLVNVASVERLLAAEHDDEAA
jgi:hypothetical protein